MHKPVEIQLHRFRGDVAISLGQGETAYLTPVIARKVAAALRACAKDIGAHEFYKSQFATVRFEQPKR